MADTEPVTPAEVLARIDEIGETRAHCAIRRMLDMATERRTSSRDALKGMTSELFRALHPFEQEPQA
jgi:hypothetical protein